MYDKIATKYPLMTLWNSLFHFMEHSLKCTGVCDKQLGLFMFSDVSNSPALKSCQIGLGDFFKRNMNWIGGILIVAGIYVFIMMMCCAYQACGCGKHHGTFKFKKNKESELSEYHKF